MKLKIPKIKKTERLFFLSYIIFMTFSVLMHSLYYQYFFSYYKVIAGICIVLLLIQEITNTTMSYSSMIGAIILSFVALLLMLQGTGNTQTSFACVFVFAYSVRNIDFRKICRITVILTLSLVIFVILSSMLGIIQNYHTIQNGIRHRYFLGFRYALNAPAFVLNVILLYAYMKRGKAKLIEIGVLFLISYVLFLATNSRLTFGLSIVGLLISLVNKIRKDDFNNLQKLPLFLIPSFVICFSLSIWFALMYSENVPWMRELNTVLGNRLKYGRDSLLMYGVNLFGFGNIEWVGAGLDAYGNQSSEAYFYVDNLYIQILQRYGIIFIIIFLILTTALMIQCYRKNEHLLVIVFAVIALHGLIDDGVLYLQMNTFLLLLGSAVFGYIRSRKVEKKTRVHKKRLHIK